MAGYADGRKYTQTSTHTLMVISTYIYKDTHSQTLRTTVADATLLSPDV